MDWLNDIAPYHMFAQFSGPNECKSFLEKELASLSYDLGLIRLE